MIQQLFCNGDSSPTTTSCNLFDNVSFVKPNENETDALISEALEQMTIAERERTYFEMHGVAVAIEETPELVAEKLKELQQELFRLKLRSNLPSKAFKLAESQNPNFVYNQVYGRRFLRGSEFEAEKAATKMIRFYDLKLQLFGERKLCKEITLDDLNEEDIDVLKKGYFQKLPERDRAGRPVCVAILANQKYASAECVVRVLFDTVYVSTFG
jgi:hypothetical protein